MNMRFAFIVLAIALGYNSAKAQTKKDSLKILFVGNSYTYFSNMPHLVSAISDSTPVKLVTSKSVIGGARLSQHWKGERNLKTKAILKNGNFDIVVLQDQSMSAVETPDSLLFYVKKFSNYIKKQGAKPYLYATWAREKVPQYQEIIDSVYNQAAQENNIGVVNVGKVWEKAKSARPTVQLFNDDGSHPTDLGAFLTACTFVKAFTGTLPEKLHSYWGTFDSQGESVTLVHLNELDMVFCLKVVESM